MADLGHLTVHVCGGSDVGRTREHNEDAFAVADLTTATTLPFAERAVQTATPGPRGLLFMVADGMGGAAAGEIASSMAVDVVLQELTSRWSNAQASDAATFAAALQAAATVANERIYQFASEHPEYRGMGTTATIAGVLGDMLYIAQVGDSRAYLVRGDEARQMTKDQSLIQRLIDAGELTAEEAEVSDRRNIILQALGPEGVVSVDVTHQALRRGDTLVLCSDGLSGVVRDQDIARAAQEESDVAVLCARLIDQANASGGPDNITVVAARFEGPALADAEPEDEVGHYEFPVPDMASIGQPSENGPTAAIPAAPAPSGATAAPEAPPDANASTRATADGTVASPPLAARRGVLRVAAVILIAAAAIIAFMVWQRL
jgi:serine/threonine protein phosphatase PrpC